MKEGEIAEARWCTVVLSYCSIVAGAILILIAFAGYSEFKDEKTMSTIIFVVIAFVEILGGIFVIGVWQPETLPKRRLKEIQCSIVIGGLMVFMGIFFIMDGFRHYASGTLSRRGASVRVVESLFSCISGLLLGVAKYFFGHKMKSFVVVADSLTCFCAGITSMVSLIVLAFRSVHLAQQLARLFAALFTVYCGVMVIGHANTSMQAYKDLRDRVGSSEKEKDENLVPDGVELQGGDDFAFLFNYELMISTIEHLYKYPVEFFTGKSKGAYTPLPSEDSEAEGMEGGNVVYPETAEDSFQSESFVAR